jgi:protein-disulfide isomerase
MGARSFRAALAVALLGIVTMPAAADERRAAQPPLVEIDGHALPDEEVERSVALQVYQLEARVHALRRRAVNDAITRHLLAREAQRQGVSVEALVAREIDAKVVPPTAEEVQQAVAVRIRTKPAQGEALEHLRASVEAAMRAERRSAQHERYVSGLRAAATIVVRLPEEPVLRMAIPTAGEPSLGPADAPVTLIEFSDFQCPFCRAVQPTLAALRERYGDRLRIVHRDFPSERHRAARRAAEAARCAGEQNAYWPYHDALYGTALVGGDVELGAIAAKLSLDAAAFTACLNSRRHATVVQQGVLDGKAAGVTGTPTFFVNGRPLVGAVPIEEFRAVIDRELARQPTAKTERTRTP